MNAPLLPEILRRRAEPGPQEDALPASEEKQLHVWDSRWGTTLIEVRGDEVFVNGERVERYRGD